MSRNATGVTQRPGTKLKALARQHTEDAIQRLAKLMNDGNSCVAVAAARELLERGYGKVSHEQRSRRRRPQAEPQIAVKIRRFGEVNDNAP